MSIASEIQRIKNDKASLKTALESKGVIVPENASLDTYATLVGDVPSGLEMQNAQITNYKALTGTVKAGSFIKRQITYNTGDIRTILSQSTSTAYSTPMTNNLIHLRDDIYVFLSGYNTSSINAIRITPSGISRFCASLQVATNTYDQRFLIKIDDNTLLHLYHSSSNGSHKGQIIKLNTSFSIQSTDLTEFSTSYAVEDVIRTEDDTNVYIHIIGGQALRCVAINKTNYTLTAGTNSTTKSAFVSTQITGEEIDTNKLFLFSGRFGYYQILTFNPSDLTYTSDTTGQISSSYGIYRKVNNQHILIYNSSSTLYLSKLSISGNSVSISSTTNLGTYNVTNPIVYYRLNIIDNDTLLLSYGNTDNKLYGRIIKIGDSVAIYDSVEIGSYTYNSSDTTRTIGYSLNAYPIDTNLVFVLAGYTAGLYNIVDNKLSLITGTNSVILLATSQTAIAGLTKTDCTTKVAGEVYTLRLW